MDSNSISTNPTLGTLEPTVEIRPLDGRTANHESPAKRHRRSHSGEEQADDLSSIEIADQPAHQFDDLA
jgi:hypothetical protein